MKPSWDISHCSLYIKFDFHTVLSKHLILLISWEVYITRLHLFLSKVEFSKESKKKLLYNPSLFSFERLQIVGFQSWIFSHVLWPLSHKQIHQDSFDSLLFASLWKHWLLNNGHQKLWNITSVRPQYISLSWFVFGDEILNFWNWSQYGGLILTKKRGNLNQRLFRIPNLHGSANNLLTFEDSLKWSYEICKISKSWRKSF